MLLGQAICFPMENTSMQATLAGRWNSPTDLLYGNAVRRTRKCKGVVAASIVRDPDLLSLRRKRCTPTPRGDLYIRKKILFHPHGKPLHRTPRLSQLRLHVKSSSSPHEHYCPAATKAHFNFRNLDSAWCHGGRLKHCKILIVCKNKHSVPLI